MSKNLPNIKPLKGINPRLIAVVLIVAISGTLLLLNSHASSPYVSINADQGKLDGAAEVQSDPNADDGQSVQFGSSGAPGAGLIWSDDFSSGNLSDWNNQSCPGGVTIVRNPVRDPGGYATAFTVSDTSTDVYCPAVPTENPRSQLVGKVPFHDGDDRYIAFSTFFPSDFPSIISPDWLQFAEVYGKPYNGSPSIGLDVKGNRIYYYTGVAGYGTIWTSPTDIPKGTAWEDIVLHIKFSSDPKVGFVELWLNGVRQTFGNGSQRFYYDTITPGLNDGGSNFLYLNQYRSVQVSLGTVTLYHADPRIGTTYQSVAY